MSYKNDSELVILNQYSKSSSNAKAELYETYDRLRDLTVSGPTIGGSGVGKFGSFLMNIARTFGGSPFIPTFGSEAVNIPGTSYYAPISGGTGITPGGQAAFGLSPFSQYSGLPTGGAAPINGNVDPITLFSSAGIGATTNQNLGFTGIGDPSFPVQEGLLGAIPPEGVIAGYASPFVGSSAVSGAANAGGAAAGTAAGAGFGRNWVLPAAGIVSGIGGLLTTLGPFFGPFGIAAAAGGAVLNGGAGAVLASFQHVASRILVNADVVLTNKIKNLETTVKQLDAQQTVVRKLLKESIDSDRKALDNL
ncbi:MAG: hypothetical protein KTR14_02305 [Vampirovibrio sp.]|nr:hypothetical protein [Vampirovibrio sp.]